MAIAFALLSSLCFGIAHVSASVGLRSLDPRSGAAISIPTATLLFAAAAPFALDLSQFSATAALLFALVGVFFPALVTLLNFRSTSCSVRPSPARSPEPLLCSLSSPPRCCSARRSLRTLPRPRSAW